MLGVDPKDENGLMTHPVVQDVLADRIAPEFTDLSAPIVWTVGADGATSLWNSEHRVAEALLSRLHNDPELLFASLKGVFDPQLAAVEAQRDMDLQRRLGAAMAAIDALRLTWPAGVHFECTRHASHIHLDVLRVANTGQGIGTQVLTDVLNVFDEHGVEAHGEVDPTDEPEDPDTTTLLRWYAKHGFVVTGVDADTGQPLIGRVPVSGGPSVKKQIRQGP